MRVQRKGYMRKSTRNIFAAAEPRGDVTAVREFVQGAADANADAVFLLGGLKRAGDRPRVFGEILKALASCRLPSFYIPGPDDAPITEYLREAADMEVVFPFIRGVHSTFAFAPGYVLVSGFGGRVEDRPDAVREEGARLSYPGWELEYRLKFVRELRDYAKIFLFSQSPAHKGLSQEGSETVAEMIKTHNPRLVLVSGEQQRTEMLARSLVVSLGTLSKGQFSTVNFVSFGVEHRQLRKREDIAA